MLKLKPENIPNELKKYDQWVTWRVANRYGKLTKVPYQINGRHASVSNPETWASFDEVLRVYQEKLGSWEMFSGIGFVLTFEDDIVAVDLDHCVDNNDIHPQAQAIVDKLGSYTELSPSGSGIRIMLRGNLPPGARRKGFVEVYNAGRFVTITGHVIGKPREVIAANQPLIEVYRREIGEIVNHGLVKPGGLNWEAGPDLSESELTARIEKACKSSESFSLLFNGDISAHNGDHSRADLALIGSLAFWFKFPKLIDAAFRKSKLMRPKWDEMRGAFKYCDRTIAQALIGRDKFYVGVDEKNVTQKGTRRTAHRAPADYKKAFK